MLFAGESDTIYFYNFASRQRTRELPGELTSSKQDRDEKEAATFEAKRDAQRAKMNSLSQGPGAAKQAPTPSRGGAGPENRAGDSTEPALLPLRREDINQAERPVVAET